MLNSGDALLLNCEGTWQETVTFGKSFAPKGLVLVGAYGTCANARAPLIKGSTPIAAGQWQLSGTTSAGNIYSTQITASVAGVLQNGKPMTRARYPNYTELASAFTSALVNTTGTKLVVTAADKQYLSGRDLLGAGVGLRPAHYMVEAGEVTSYDTASGTVTLKTLPKTAIGTGAGYFFEGKRWMLDAPNEWLHETSTNTLSVFVPTGTTLSSTTFEYTAPRSTLVFTGIPGLRVENLAISGAGEDGLQVVESGGARITSVQVSYARSHGINVSSLSGLPVAQGVTVENSTVIGSGVTGIGSSVTETNITGNSVAETGSAVIGIIRPTAGIRLSQIKNSVVSGNSVSKSGYSGILFGNQENIVIRDNYVADSCLLLSDCGGVYSWGSSASSTRSSITNNHIVRAFPAVQGAPGAAATGGAPDLVAGIYLDEGSNNLDVTSNYIDDTYVGINLHKSKNNTLSRNQIYGVREAGIRAQSSGTDSLSVSGNRVEDNIIFAPSYFIKAADGSPLAVGATPQIWIHQSDAAGMFTGTSKNIVARNTAIHMGEDDSALRWILRSGSNTQTYSSRTWSTYASTDTVKSPFQASVVSVQGTQLLGNSTMEAAALPWTSYSYTAGANIVQFGTQSGCTSSCATFVPATSNDVLQQIGLKPSAGSANLMYLRYRAHAGTKATSAKLEVRSNASPYASAGYLENGTELAAGARLAREAFFTRTTTGELRLSVKATIGAPLYIDSIELFQVSAYTIQSPLTYGRLLANTGSQVTSFSCASLGLSSCTIVNESGISIAWPVTVSAKSARLIFIKDTSWAMN